MLFDDIEMSSTNAESGLRTDLKPRDDVEVLHDSRTVWVNGPDGLCIGRFGRRGIDVHRSMAEQLKTGKQCLACTHSRPDLVGWEQFIRLMAG